MGKSDELPVVDGIGSEPSYGDSHSVLVVDIHKDLGPVVLLEVLDELLGRVGKVEVLRLSLELLHGFDELFLGGGFSQLDEHRCGVSVEYGNTDALAGDLGCLIFRKCSWIEES